MTFVLNMDRTNIANAISDHLPEHLGFNTDGVNLGTLVHSIVFTIFTLPTNPIVKRVGAHLWIPILMTSWGINFNGFIAIRFFIALTEAGFIPASLTYLTGWYKTSEFPSRLAWFWGIQAFASAFSGLISFGIFRLAGVAGLYGWKWLFLIDGIFTHIVGFIAFLYLPANPARTNVWIRGKKPWLTEREAQIAVTRLIRDDLTKKDQYKRVTWNDVFVTLKDTKAWTHLFITFIGFIPHTPINVYFPTLIRNFGYSVTTSNLLTVPSYFINLSLSILIAKSAEKRGNYGLHALIACIWILVGFMMLEFLPDSADKSVFYVAALIAASAPSYHGMHIGWMSSNLAPIGKRTLALGAIIGSANICGVPGSFVYRQYDAPRYHTGNWINIALTLITTFLFLFQHFRYKLTNKYREKKWNALSDKEKKQYIETTKDLGSNRLDYRFNV
ncbi:major facilitator superfamily domain-containing protein [Cunninghamella echinulata]|nr:major facilitator superfamily domain-containing protein [Cunninghamella echinulata]